MYIELIPFHYSQVYLLSNKSRNTTCFNSSVSKGSGYSRALHKPYTENVGCLFQFLLHSREDKSIPLACGEAHCLVQIQYVTHHRYRLTFHSAKYYHAAGLKQHET